MSDQDERARLIAEVRSRLEMERAFGADVCPVGKFEPVNPAVRPAVRPAAKPRQPAPVAAGEDAGKRRELEEFRASIETCQKCPLGATRTKFVFGTGRADARLLFIGEAPGADEDRQGEPFVGRAGQLLTKMIQAMGLDRADVYIGNILKCRPPQNRTPSVEEMIVCLPHILEQIKIIQPQVICALGATALKGLFRDPKVSITRMRGEFIDWNGIKLIPTFHPAYLLRQPGEKRKVWEDLQKIMTELGLQSPSA